MRLFTNRIRSTIVALAAGFASLGFAASAQADDKLHLNDGSILEGEILREVDGHVHFRYEVAGIAQEKWYTSDAIKKIERDAVTDDPQPHMLRAVTPDDERVQAKPGVPRIAILSFGEGGSADTVGIHITAQAFEGAIPLLEQEGVTDVVIRVNSGGGLVLEVDRLAHVFQEQYKPKFRLVSWIESAISAAAMSTHCIEEIYFKSEGNYGACTAWSGDLEAVKGRGLEGYLAMMERISDWGNHDRAVMRAMQINERLSASIDNAGRVNWYQDLTGDYVVNDGEDVLTFNSNEAAKFKFAAGVADTKEELARAMGYTEVEWVGKDVRGEVYPICKAEEFMQKYRDDVVEDQRRTGEYYQQYQQSVAMAQGFQERRDRAKFVNKARQALKMLDRMFQRNFNFALMQLGVTSEEAYEEWYREQERLLRELL